MESIPSLYKCILKDGHQCGVCHNVSDTKVSIKKSFCKLKQGYKIIVKLFEYFVPCVDIVRALYTFL